MSISKRQLLIVLISAAQLACLAGGIALFGHMLAGRLHATMRRQILDDNRQLAAQMATIIGQADLDEVRDDERQRQRLQRMIEQVRLPNDGFLCVIRRDDGRILCHPDLLQRRDLASATPGWAALDDDERLDTIIDRLGAGERSFEGWATMPDGTHLIGVRDMPELGVTVMAHQREAGVTAAVGRLTSIIWVVGGSVSLLVVVFGTALTALLMQGYENRLVRINKHLEDVVEQRGRSLMRTRDAVIFGLAKLAESRDDDTGQHLDRIRQYVEILARGLAARHEELDDAMIRTLGLASSLHDIGKVGIPDAILLKRGPLSDEEFAVMRKHTLIGGDCLLAIKRRLGDDDFLVTACEIALSHHERWDGAGYPYGLRGHQISLAGRIVALADVYDALTSRRVYKDAMAHDEARRIILEGRGTQFDPDVVDAFVEQEKLFRAVVSITSGEWRTAA